jgi:hypothetical protein
MDLISSALGLAGIAIKSEEPTQFSDQQYYQDLDSI